MKVSPLGKIHQQQQEQQQQQPQITYGTVRYY